MGGRFHEHVRSNVVSYVALFAFAFGGTAQAVDGPLPGVNTVDSLDIINNDVGSVDVTDGGIGTLDIRGNSIQSSKIQNLTLTGADVAPDGLTGASVAESTLFNDNSLTSADIDEATLFNDNSLTAADLAASSINASEAATSSVDSDEVASNAMTSADLASASVDSSEIAAGAVTASELTEVSIRKLDGNLGPFGTDDFLVACPPGHAVIGGDYLSVRHDVRINASFPSESTTEINFPENGDTAVAWWSRFQSVSPFSRPVTSFVICVEST